MPEVETQCAVGVTDARSWSQQQRTWGSEHEDRDHGVVLVAAADAVAVPGHAVAPVAVEAQAGSRERLAELGRVMPVEFAFDDDECRVGKGVLLVDEVQQSWDVDDLVEHRTALRMPLHAAAQSLEQRVSATYPVVVHVDPGAVAQRGADRCQLCRTDIVLEVEQ